MSPLFNYERITEFLKIFFQNYKFKSVNASNLITNETFNYGLTYEDPLIPPNTFVIQKCSRIDDIQYADKLCTLPLFHIFACSQTLKLNILIDFFKYLINGFGLDPSKFYLETSYPLEYLVKEIHKTCGINNVKYIDENDARILNNGAGSLIIPYGSPNGTIYSAMSVNYAIDENTQIEIFQIIEYVGSCSCNKRYAIGIGIERLYTAINYGSDVFIPSWYNTIPLFKSVVENESNQLGVPLPIGYDLIINP